jgi:hypothetical protein
MFYDTPETQLKQQEDWLKTKLRKSLSGNHPGYYNAPQWKRQEIERAERRHVKTALDKMLKDVDNVDNYDIPNFRHDANWDWF